MSEGLSGRVYLEMDPELRTFLERHVDSFTKVELLHFFHDHPHSLVAVEMISMATGRETEDLQLELDDLVANGLVQSRRVGTEKAYALTTSPHLWRQLRRFVEACRDHRFRIRLVYYLVRGRDG